MEFSSVLPWWPGDGEDLEEVGDTLGKRLWPGEKSAGELDLEEVGGGWNAEGKDFRIGVSPAMLNIGLNAAEAVRAGSRDSRAGWRNGEGS